MLSPINYRFQACCWKPSQILSGIWLRIHLSQEPTHLQPWAAAHPLCYTALGTPDFYKKKIIIRNHKFCYLPKTASIQAFDSVLRFTEVKLKFGSLPAVWNNPPMLCASLLTILLPLQPLPIHPWIQKPSHEGDPSKWGLDTVMLAASGSVRFSLKSGGIGWNKGGLNPKMTCIGFNPPHSTWFWRRPNRASSMSTKRQGKMEAEEMWFDAGQPTAA